MQEKQPRMKVNSRKNHFLIAGLVPLNGEHSPKEFIGDKENFAIKTSHSFIDGLLGAITFGIYTPTTTTYYLPVE